MVELASECLTNVICTRYRRDQRKLEAIVETLLLLQHGDSVEKMHG